jgi:DNA-binding transcriptional regulator YiaG
MELGKREPMSIEDIRELMALKGWRATHLAAALDLTETTVYRWLMGLGVPKGPARVLMRLWLEEARASSNGAKTNGRKRVTA